MCVLFWLYLKFIAHAPTRNGEILIMLWIDIVYLACFWAIRKMGKQLDEEGEEKMLGADIEFHTGHMGGDASSAYRITLQRTFTVKEFVERVLNERGEWGKIEVELPDRTTVAWLKYSHGDITNESSNLASYYDHMIESVSGNGGWSNSNFYIEVKA